jgi:hypothetical protein
VQTAEWYAFAILEPDAPRSSPIMIPIMFYGKDALRQRRTVDIDRLSAYILSLGDKFGPVNGGVLRIP